MNIPLYQVDAFTDEVFGGNPAVVCILESWPETEILQKIAAENYVPETAFFHKNGVESFTARIWGRVSRFQVRPYFTPRAKYIRNAKGAKNCLMPRRKEILNAKAQGNNL